VDGLLVGAALGLGVLLVFDALTRPDAKPDPAKWAAKLGPKGLAAAVCAGTVLAVTQWPVAVLAGGILGARLPSMLRNARLERLRVERIEAIAELSARLRDSLRAGIGIQDALSRAALSAGPAICLELRQMVAEARVSGLGAAARSFADRLGPDADTLAAALALGDRIGARNTSEVLDSLAESTAATAATLREARARQTRARTSARVVAAAPLVLLLVIRLSNPQYLEPYNRPGGQLLLAFGLLLIAAGYGAMLRTARVGKALQ
jgi:Flp pilus assembly protein TadB